MTKLNTPEALRTAIANIWAIHEFDMANWSKELHSAMHIIKHKLYDLTMEKIND